MTPLWQEERWYGDVLLLLFPGEEAPRTESDNCVCHSA